MANPESISILSSSQAGAQAATEVNHDGLHPQITAEQIFTSSKGVFLTDFGMIVQKLIISYEELRAKWIDGEGKKCPTLERRSEMLNECEKICKEHNIDMAQLPALKKAFESVVEERKRKDQEDLNKLFPPARK
ncbi:MAG: hypothetical protein HY424_01505 [Candidatus Levybacteria bacterium]|nr:hypothetical protein [Candidatus Levybacteria bacterium]